MEEMIESMTRSQKRIKKENKAVKKDETQKVEKAR